MMGIAKQSWATASPARVEYYLDEAHGAEATMSFLVRVNAEGAAYRQTPHFSTAYSWIRWEPNSSVQVLFRWRSGEREGDGVVTYRSNLHPAASQGLVLTTIHNMISRAIGESLASGTFIIADPEDPDQARTAQAASKPIS